MRGNSLIFAAVSPRKLRLWDAVSGTVACDHAVSDRKGPVTTYIEALDLVSVSGHEQSRLLELRRPASLCGDDTQREEESNNDVCCQTLAPSAWRIAAFDLSSDGNEVTILEGTQASAQRRVRTFGMNSGQESQRWTVRKGGGGSSQHAAPVQGILVRPSGVHATLDLPGFPFLLTEEGFKATHGLEMPVVETQPLTDNTGSVRWEFSKNFAAESAFPVLQPCITLRLPRPFPRDGESLELEITDGQKSETRSFSSKGFMPTHDGWLMLRPDYFWKKDAVKADLTVRLNVESDQVSIATNSSEAEPNSIQPGPAFLIPTGFGVQNAYNHGVASVQADGTTFAVDDDLRLLKWREGERLPTLAWTDPDDTWVAIRDLDSGNHSTVFGTRKGDVYLAETSEKIRTLFEAPRTNSNGDTVHDVQCVAMTPDDSFAAAGNLNGELLLFDLTNSEQSLVGRTKVHNSGISTMAMSDTSRFIATADEQRNLRLWQRKGDSVELLLELDQLDNPAIQIKFSPQEDRLFVLCANERGLRILNLDALHQVFAESGIDWTD